MYIVYSSKGRKNEHSGINVADTVTKMKKKRKLMWMSLKYNYQSSRRKNKHSGINVADTITKMKKKKKN